MLQCMWRSGICSYKLTLYNIEKQPINLLIKVPEQYILTGTCKGQVPS